MILFFLFLRKQKRATERNARKNNPPSETKMKMMTVWCPGVGGCGGGGEKGWGGDGIICGGGGGKTEWGGGGTICGGGGGGEGTT